MNNHDSERSRARNRDAALERAWRDASTELPPSHVDAAILAAARQSVQDRKKQPDRINSHKWLTQWQPLAAAAVVATLAFGIVQMLPRELDLAPSMQRTEPVPVPTSAEPPPESRPQTQSLPELRSSPAREMTNERRPAEVPRVLGAYGDANVAGRAPTQSAVAAPPAAAPARATTVESAANDIAPETTTSDAASKAEANAGDAAPTADTAAGLGAFSADRHKAAESNMAGRAATAAAPAPRASQETRGIATQLDPPAWAAKVAALHTAGDVTAAEHALREFRMVVADADTYLPDSLRSWARTVE